MDHLEPPFTFYGLKNLLIIKRGNTIMRLNPMDQKCEVSPLQEGQAEKLKASALMIEQVYGVFGYLTFKQNNYLVLVKDASVVGSLLDKDIYKVEKLMYIPAKTIEYPVQIASGDKAGIRMIENVMTHDAFYFSYQYDLTRNIQTVFNSVLAQKVNNQPVAKFCFNNYMLSEFSQPQYQEFIVPCIYGYIGIQAITSTKKFALISRKDCRRPGRRFVVRGLDTDGNAANFVETEHIMTVYGSEQNINIMSHVQIRGSIPLLWHSKPNIKWAPTVVTNPNFDESLQSARKHMQDTLEPYNRQYMVNLIDRKGSQQRIGVQFSKIIDNMKDYPVEYTWFDFHGECKKMKWENLSKLVRIVKDQLENWAHFTATVRLNGQGRVDLQPQNVKIHSRQNGYFRTNCMDCLDRTNVVQSVFSRNIMHNQLHFFGFEKQPSGRPFEEFEPQLEEAFRAIWTDNADRLSIMYTGTPALKTDFTRTGKRSHKGAMNDGKNSLHRYYINNFTDGYNHDSLDLALGKLSLAQIPKPKTFTPLKQYFIGMILSLVLANFVMNEYVPAEENNMYNSMLYNIVYGLIIFTTYTAVKQNGRKCCNDTTREM